MHRFAFLYMLVFASSALSCSHHHHRDYHGAHRDYHGAHRDYHGCHRVDKDFHSISWDIIRADRTVQRICNSNSNHLTESLLPDSYRLQVTLPEFSPDDIKVKIKYRVLLVQAVKGEQLFSEVKVMPEFVNVSEAAWTYSDDQLIVDVPYRSRGSGAVKSCKTGFDDTEINLEMTNQIDVRFNRDTTTNPPLDENVY